MQDIHGLHRQQDKDVPPRFSLGIAKPQFEFAATVDHFIDYLIDCIRVLTGPWPDGFSQRFAISTQKRGGRHIAGMLSFIGKQTQ